MKILVTVLVVVCLLLDVAVLCSDTVTVVMKEVLFREEPASEIPEPAFTPDSVEPVQWQVYMDVNKTHPQRVLGNAALWVAYNANALSGWSWTGYSRTSLDDQLRASRWKFGLIGGELESMRGIHDPQLRHLYDGDDLGMQYGSVFGIHWGKEF